MSEHRSEAEERSANGPSEHRSEAEERSANGPSEHRSEAEERSANGPSEHRSEPEERSANGPSEHRSEPEERSANGPSERQSFTASLSSTTLAGSPGATAGCDVLVANTGTEAATLDIGLGGPAAGWGVVVPVVLVVGPGASAWARVTFDVPPSDGLVGTSRAFEVRVGSRTLAGRLEINEVRDLRVSVSPLLARSRGSTAHTVIVENRGTGLRRLALAATSVHDDVRPRLADHRVEVAPGEQVRVALTVTPRHRSFGRRPRSRPFTVQAEPESGPAITLGGTHVQDPVRWRVATAAAAGMVLAAALAIGPARRVGSRPVLVTAAVPVKAAIVAPTCPDRATATPVRVDIAMFAFCPAVLTVPVGTDVEWVNADLSPHTVTDEAADTRFDSGPLAQGRSWSIRFTQPGTYRYVCLFHPGMAGTVFVA